MKQSLEDAVTSFASEFVKQGGNLSEVVEYLCGLTNESFSNCIIEDICPASTCDDTKRTDRLDEIIDECLGEWEKLGVTFRPYTLKNEYSYQMILPNGWKVETSENSIWFNIMDQNGNVRGSFFLKGRKKILGKPITKYGIMCRTFDVIGKDGKFLRDSQGTIIKEKKYYFGNEKEVLYDVPDRVRNICCDDSKEEQKKIIAEKTKKRKEAHIWAMTHGYSDYEDPAAYWDKSSDTRRRV